MGEGCSGVEGEGRGGWGSRENLQYHMCRVSCFIADADLPSAVLATSTGALAPGSNGC